MPLRSKVLFSAVANNEPIAPWRSRVLLSTAGNDRWPGVGVGSLVIFGVLPGLRSSSGLAVGDRGLLQESSGGLVHREGDRVVVVASTAVALLGCWIVATLGEVSAVTVSTAIGLSRDLVVAALGGVLAVVLMAGWASAEFRGKSVRNTEVVVSGCLFTLSSLADRGESGMKQLQGSSTY